MKNLFKDLELEVDQKRQVIFNKGEIGQKFYIMLRGEVYVLASK